MVPNTSQVHIKSHCGWLLLYVTTHGHLCRWRRPQGTQWHPALWLPLSASPPPSRYAFCSLHLKTSKTIFKETKRLRHKLTMTNCGGETMGIFKTTSQLTVWVDRSHGCNSSYPAVWVLTVLRKGTPTLLKFLAVCVSSFSLPRSNWHFKDLLSLLFYYACVEVGGLLPGSREAGVVSDRESRSVGAENQTQIDPLQERCVLSAIKPSAQPCNWHFKTIAMI